MNPTPPGSPMSPPPHPIGSNAVGAARREARGPVLALLGCALLGWRVRPVLGLASALAVPALLYLFRDPPRVAPQRSDLLMAPADGRVLDVRPVVDGYWEQEMWEVVIFLSLLDVHVQRSPLAGTVVGTHYRPGAHRPALWPSASERNERLETYIRGTVPVTVTQVAGILARAIVSWVQPGQQLIAGERLGMIKLGSQTHLRFPRRVRPLVAPGDRVQAALTPVARIED
ncbi:MAG: phosphatidylserine decarboxylase [Chloroflexi bacterium]|nr:phosphatidylserine decarboxylase [Chloroflexota bacterium]